MKNIFFLFLLSMFSLTAFAQTTIGGGDWYRVAESSQINVGGLVHLIEASDTLTINLMMFSTSNNYDRRSVYVDGVVEFANNPFETIRIVQNTLSDPAYVEIFIPQGSTYDVAIQSNASVNSLTAVAYTLGTIPSGWEAKQISIQALDFSSPFVSPYFTESSGGSDGDGDAQNELQTLDLTNETLSISNGNSIDLSPILLSGDFLRLTSPVTDPQVVESDLMIGSGSQVPGVHNLGAASIGLFGDVNGINDYLLIINSSGQPVYVGSVLTLNEDYVIGGQTIPAGSYTGIDVGGAVNFDVSAHSSIGASNFSVAMQSNASWENFGNAMDITVSGETTLQDILNLPAYPNTRNDFLSGAPVNFLYTDAQGLLLTQPVDNLDITVDPTDVDWTLVPSYIDNTAAFNDLGAGKMWQGNSSSTGVYTRGGFYITFDPSGSGN